MNRRKARARPREYVVLHLFGPGYDGVVLTLDDVSPAEFADLRERVAAGNVDDPAVIAFTADLRAALDLGPSVDDTVLLHMCGFQLAAGGGWTNTDDLALNMLLGGDTPPE